MPEENINTYTIDASFILAFLLPDEHTKQVEEVFKQYIQGKINFIASEILPFEVANSLKHAAPKRISPQSVRLLIEDFLKYKIGFKKVNFKEVVNLSLNTGLSVYDASYLYLSKIQNAPLLTLDKKLRDFT